MKYTIIIDCTPEEYKEIIELKENERAKAILSIIRMRDLVVDLNSAGWKPKDDEDA